MQLVINELLNSCRFTHLVTRDVQLQSPIILTTRILKISYNNEIIINLDMTCKVHAIST
jgi:hypothetical protein